MADSPTPPLASDPRVPSSNGPDESAPSAVCDHCSINVHEDCLRHEGASCDCTSTDECGAAIRVFDETGEVIFCNCCDPDGTHHHERCMHPCCTWDDEDEDEGAGHDG